MNLALVLRYVLAALPVLAYLFGAGDGSDFASVEAVKAFLESHFPQLGAVIGIVAAPVFFAIKWLHDRIDGGMLRNALISGKMDLGDIIGAVKDTDGPDASTYVKSALADGAFVTLFHACDFDPELTAKLNDAHSLYRLKRVEAL